MSTIWQPTLKLGKGPKYRAVARAIASGIESGALPIGEQLPPVRDLAWRLGITPGTVARAYALMTSEGHLETTVGRGTFVAPPRTQPRENDVWVKPSGAQNIESVNLLSPALPDVGQVAAVRAALIEIAKDNSLDLLNYPTREAGLAARQAVVEWLREVPLGPLSEDDVVLTYGGQNAVSLVLKTILKGPKPVLLVEDLSYAGFSRAGAQLRAETVGVAMDDKGVIPEALAAAARATGAQVFCTTPDVQNPTGVRTPLERRRELVKVAEHFKMDILEDDCYRFSRPHAPSYRVLMPDNAWHISSVSKSLTAALRVGFAVAPRGRAVDLRRSLEFGYIGMSVPMVELTRRLLSDPASKQMADIARDRIAGYVDLAVQHLGDLNLTWDREAPFLWLQLPEGWRASDFVHEAEKQGVQIRSADEFALRDGRAPHAVRISINGNVTLEAFELAMLRMRKLLDNPGSDFVI